jgi:hypothetical protein
MNKKIKKKKKLPQDIFNQSRKLKIDIKNMNYRNRNKYRKINPVPFASTLTLDEITINKENKFLLFLKKIINAIKSFYIKLKRAI